MENSPCYNFAVGPQIATNFCTCNDSTAVVPCTKLCTGHCTRIEVRVKTIPTNLNCDGKNVGETGPWTFCRKLTTAMPRDLFHWHGVSAIRSRITTSRELLYGVYGDLVYLEFSNIRRTKSYNLNNSRPVLQLPLSNLLKSGAKSRMKL